MIKQQLKSLLHLSYAKLHVQRSAVNTERCRVLRQQYAVRMIQLHQEYSLIINIDESLIKASNFYRKAWGKRNQR